MLIRRKELYGWAEKAAKVMEPSQPVALADVERLGLDKVDGLEHAGKSTDLAMAFLTHIKNGIWPIHRIL